jgi:hypothetical protein
MRKLLLLFFLFCIAFTTALAQGVTTSTLSGTVTDANGEALPGSNVVATHEPSGTQYGTSVNPNGRFTIPNMRVGGPYKIAISFVGYQLQTISDVYLKLGETYNINAKMQEEGTELNEVVVSGVQDKLLSSERNGAVTNVGSGQILTLPSISRSINDMTRITPQATSTSNGAIGGGNYRQNYITVDGSEFNNTFGIGTNLPAGGSPISLDAVEEISINITPYDVRQSAFIGSAINAVTRSGTNNFSGSAYWFFRSEKQQGDKVRNNAPFTKQDLNEDTYGFRLGGPIIKNKLFFFINAEKTNTVKPGQQNFAATDAKPFGPENPNVSRPTADELTTISNFLRENYNYETGAFDNYDFESENTKLTGRLDWNINQNHRVSLRYSQVESKSPSFLSSSTTGSNVVYGSGAGRLNSNSLWFRNSNYYQEQNFYSLALEANSTFGKIANTFRASYTNQNDPRSSDSEVFPFVDILDGSGTPFTSFGYEPFTYGNLRDVKSFSIVDFIYFNYGIHNFTAGVQFDVQKTRNGFQRFGTGYYVFNSWDDFANGANPRDYAITYSLAPGFAQAFPEVGFAQYSAYVQDEIDVTSKLKITGGLRVDLPTFPAVPEVKTHPLVADLTFGGETVDTGVMPDTKLMVSPRLGFNYDVRGDRSLQLRGGTGVFTGRVPTVWIVAQSGDAGLLQFTEAFNGQDNVPGPFRVDPYRPDAPPVPGTAVPASVSAIDPDFKFPQTWKSSLAVDIKLPMGFVGSLEGIYNKDINVALGRNPNLVAPQALDVRDANGDLIYADRRPIYPRFNTDKYLNPLISGQPVAPGTTRDGAPVSSSNDASAFNPVILDNASDGYYWSVTAKLEKQFDNGLSAFFAYTKSQSKVLYDGIGDQLLNTWSLTPIANTGNAPGMSYAGYVVPDRIVAGLTFRKEYLRHLATSISLFMEGSIQGRYSYTYGGDFNRDGQTNDLIYIPYDASEITFSDFTYSGVVYTAAQQSALFFKYIEQDEYLSSRRGQYAERNGAKLPWRNQVDLKITQDIFTNLGGKKNTLQLSVDIFNLGNRLNKHWGTFDQVNAAGILVPTNANSLVAGGNVKPTFRLQTDRGQPVTATFRDNNSIISTYYMQFGLRYIFN